jgi:hypothetical protein
MPAFPLFAGPYSFPESWLASSLVLRRQSLLICTAFPQYQHTGQQFLRRSAGGARAPVRALVTSRSLAGGPAAAFAASSFRALLRTSFSDLSPPMRRCCFTSRSLTPSTNAWAVSVCMKSTVSLTRSRCASCSTAAANSCYDSSISWFLAFSYALLAAASWLSPKRPSRAPTLSSFVASGGALCGTSEACP